MSMKKFFEIAAAVGLAATAAELIASAYMFNKVMTRSRLDTETATQMSGTDWGKYVPMIEERREFMLSCKHRELYEQSFDGVRLHATYFPRGDEKTVAICLHGYTSRGMNDYVALSDFYLKKNISMLLPDLRGHGSSQGKYVGFGCLDRRDLMYWINRIIVQNGEDVQIILHGTSLGGATVLMSTGLSLPPQVKGVVSDCGFTSPREVFTHVLKNWYHMPAFPMLNICNVYSKVLAGYTMDECDSKIEVEKSKVPFLLIHGSEDTFVPAYMCDDIAMHCATKVTKLIVEGAAHAESYYKDMEAYEDALDTFLKENLGK